MSPEPKTPPHRRLIPTDTRGIYRRGSRYVAVTNRGGKRVKTTHDTGDRLSRTAVCGSGHSVRQVLFAREGAMTSGWSPSGVLEFGVRWPRSRR